jgi:hypothetical protein
VLDKVPLDGEKVDNETCFPTTGRFPADANIWTARVRVLSDLSPNGLALAVVQAEDILGASDHVLNILDDDDEDSDEDWEMFINTLKEQQKADPDGTKIKWRLKFGLKRYDARANFPDANLLASMQYHMGQEQVDNILSDYFAQYPAARTPRNISYPKRQMEEYEEEDCADHDTDDETHFEGETETEDEDDGMADIDEEDSEGEADEEVDGNDENDEESEDETSEEEDMEDEDDEDGDSRYDTSL